jgi:hypothetical protein
MAAKMIAAGTMNSIHLPMRIIHREFGYNRFDGMPISAANGERVDVDSVRERPLKYFPRRLSTLISSLNVDFLADSDSHFELMSRHVFRVLSCSGAVSGSRQIGRGPPVSSMRSATTFRMSVINSRFRCGLLVTQPIAIDPIQIASFIVSGIA